MLRAFNQRQYRFCAKVIDRVRTGFENPVFHAEIYLPGAFMPVPEGVCPNFSTKILNKNGHTLKFNNVVYPTLIVMLMISAASHASRRGVNYHSSDDSWISKIVALFDRNVVFKFRTLNAIAKNVHIFGVELANIFFKEIRHT